MANTAFTSGVTALAALINQSVAKGYTPNAALGPADVPTAILANILSDGSLLLRNTAVAALGFSTGAGGAITQQTNSATGVTLSKPCGQITTVALTTAAGAEEVFTVTNTLVAATDVIAVSTTYAGAGTPIVAVKKVATSAFDIVITNLHSANALDAAVVINFVVLKSVAA